jgi:hypothetical protein
MDRELARKQPAQIINATTERVPDIKRLPRTEVMECPFHERQILVAQVHKLARRGEVAATYRIRSTERGWAVQVTRLREPGRRWRKPALIALGALVAVAGVFWVLALAVQALATALAAAVPVLLGVLGVLALLGLLAAIAGASGGTTIIQSVKIK